MSEVPCNGCTRCCWRDAVRILPHEDASRWKTEQHPLNKWFRMLAHKADGSCYYLRDNGCSIQNDKPEQCVEMDCRNIARRYSYTDMRKLGKRPLPVWRKGKELEKRHGNKIRKKELGN